LSDFTRPPTAQQAVLVELRRRIATGELRAGEQVRQDALAAQLGVSRVPLREALKMLEGEGQVVYHPRRGYFVATLDLADLVEVYRLRELLEAEAVRSAVPALDAAALSALGEAVAAGRAADADDDVAAMVAANRRFHFGLLAAADRPRLLRLIRVLWDATDAYRSVYYGDADTRAQVHREHEAILRACVRADTEQVVALLAAHRDHAVVALSAVLAAP